MPTPTYTPLATVTLGSSASSVTFSSIPATYRDLVLVYAGRTTSTADGDALIARYNGDTGSNYSQVRMAGFGTTTFSGSFSGTVHEVGRLHTSISDNTNPSQGLVNLMDYSATDKHKTSVSRSGYAANLVDATAARWANTAAITTILLFPATTTNFAAGATFNLYGVIA
jgi:hypothetical protein